MSYKIPDCCGQRMHVEFESDHVKCLKCGKRLSGQEASNTWHDALKAVRP